MNKFLLLISILSFPLLSHSYEMGCDAGEDKKTSQLTNDINDIYPVNDADSCAVKDQLSKVASWRDAIPTKIQKFVTANTKIDTKFEDLESVVINSTNAPANIRAAVDSALAEYTRTNDNYKKLINNSGASEQQKRAVTNQVNAAVNKFNKANSQLQQSLAPIQQKVRDVLIKKLSSEAFNKKLSTLAANKHCIKNAEFKMSPLNGFYDNEKSEADLAKQISGMENDLSGDSVTICSGIEKNKSATVAAATKEDFDIGDEDFFGDNQHELSADKVKRIVGKIATSLKSDKADCKKSIKSVQISTSSNQLANADEIGRWEFLKLSTNRANFLADIVKKNFSVHAKNIQTDPTGLNGDGTSGPCPYTAVKEKNGAYKVVKKDTSKMLKDLKDARYGSISLEIEEVGKGCQKAAASNARPEHEYFASKCYSVGMECAK